jgi:hypothetical protein
LAVSTLSVVVAVAMTAAGVADAAGTLAAVAVVAWDPSDEVWSLPLLPPQALSIAAMHKARLPARRVDLRRFGNVDMAMMLRVRARATPGQC